MSRAKTEASRVVAKFGPLLIEPNQLHKDKEFAKLPSIIVNKLHTAVRTMKEWDDEARQKISHKTPLDLTFSVNEVLPITKEA